MQNEENAKVPAKTKLAELMDKGASNDSELIIADATQDAEGRMIDYLRDISAKKAELNRAVEVQARSGTKFSWQKAIEIQLEIEKLERGYAALKRLKEIFL